MNVLLTSLSRKAPLVEAFRSALAARGEGGEVWGADSDPECVARPFCDGFWEMPPLSDPAAGPALRDFCAERSIALLVPTRDGELEFLAGLRDELAAAGTHVAVGTPEAVSTCLDKVAFAAHCEAHGVPAAPASTDLGAVPGDALVVKERRGAGGRSIAVGVGREQAREHARGLDEPVFQALLEGAEHSVDVYVNRAGAVVEAAPRARVRVHDGESAITETVEHPALAEAATRLAESLPLRGHLVVQGFANGAEAQLLECNARVGGASTLGFHAGVRTPEWALAEAAGETVEPRPGSYRRGLRMVRYPADLLVER